MVSTLAALRLLFVSIWLSLLLLVLYLESSYGDSNPWATCDYDPGPFCEREHTRRFLREPANSLSDFSFLALGLALILQSVLDSLALASPATLSSSRSSSSAPSLSATAQPTNLILRYPTLTLLYGLANCVHAFGTFTNHASRCHFGHRLDLTGMWAASFFSSLFSSLRLLNLLFPSFLQTQSSKDILPSLFLPLYLLSSWGHWLLSDVRYPLSYHGIEPALVVTNIVIVLLTELPYVVMGAWAFNSRRAEGRQRWTVQYAVIGLGVASIAVGAVLGHLDAHGIVCDPDAVMQLHALWHVLACVCLGCQYLYYRWEVVPPAALRKQTVAASGSSSKSL